MLLKDIVSQYGGQVALDFRHYPRASGQALAAAEAAEAAGEQGRFWDMCDALFANQAKLATANIRDIASGIGLNMSAYDASLASGRPKALVIADVNEGNRVGVRWTPYVLVNGELWDPSNKASDQALSDLRGSIERALGK